MSNTEVIQYKIIQFLSDWSQFKSSLEFEPHHREQSCCLPSFEFTQICHYLSSKVPSHSKITNHVFSYQFQEISYVLALLQALLGHQSRVAQPTSASFLAVAVFVLHSITSWTSLRCISFVLGGQRDLSNPEWHKVSTTPGMTTKHFEHHLAAECDKNPHTFRPAGKSHATHKLALYITFCSWMPDAVQTFKGKPCQKFFWFL